MEKRRELQRKLEDAEAAAQSQGHLKEEIQHLERRCQHLQVRAHACR